MAEANIHVPVLVEHRQISDTIISLKFRCCDDPATDSVATLQFTDRMKPSDIEAIIERAKNEIQAKHEGIIVMHSHIEKLTGVPRTLLK